MFFFMSGNYFCSFVILFDFVPCYCQPIKSQVLNRTICFPLFLIIFKCKVYIIWNDSCALTDGVLKPILGHKLATFVSAEDLGEDI